MIRTLPLLMPPMISLIAIVLGNGLLGTVLTLRLSIDGYSVFAIGLVSASYFAGQVSGSFGVERLVSRIGHIRAYSACASAMAIIALLQGILIEAWVWIVLRFVTGFCIAGVFIIIESWFITVGPHQKKGQLLAIYMIAQYGGIGCGQFLLNLGDPASIELFCITTMLTCFSIIPLCMTYLETPPIHEPSAKSLRALFRSSPIGQVGSFVSGLMVGAIYGLLPLYVLQIPYAFSDIALVMGCAILGGMLCQYPMGHLSDIFNRKLVIMWLCVAMMVIVSVMGVMVYYHKTTFLLLTLLFGGVAFVIYPLCISESCHAVQKKDILSVTQGLLLVYGIGSAFGPLLGSVGFFMIGHNGFIFYQLLLALILFLYIWFHKGKLSAGGEGGFVMMPRTTPIVNELDPRVDDE